MSKPQPFTSLSRGPLCLGALLLGLPALVAQSDKPAQGEAAQDKSPVILGNGKHRYEWIPGWAQLPNGENYGNTHGTIAVDDAGHVFVTTDADRPIMVFDRAGKLLSSWNKTLRGGLHGMCLRTENGEKFLYLAHTRRGQVIKATLQGKIIWTLGYPKESGHYKNKGQFRPTSVAVAPNGDLFVADGYGQSWVHQYDKDRRYKRSFGGRGKGREQMRTPHGLWLDTRAETPRLIVCDRENNRLKVYDLEGQLLSIVHGMLRRPCNVHQHGTDLVVADLAGRVTILDKDNKLVCHLGDQPNPKLRAKNRIDKQLWKNGEFLSPHGACFDAEGNLYVMDWNFRGRITKLRRLR